MAEPMCNSALHRVDEVLEPGLVLASDLIGVERRVSLLALDGPLPVPGDWLVVHSGYAISRAEASDASLAIAELDAANATELDRASKSAS